MTENSLTLEEAICLVNLANETGNLTWEVSDPNEIDEKKDKFTRFGRFSGNLTADPHTYSINITEYYGNVAEHYRAGATNRALVEASIVAASLEIKTEDLLLTPDFCSESHAKRKRGVYKYISFGAALHGTRLNRGEYGLDQSEIKIIEQIRIMHTINQEKSRLQMEERLMKEQERLKKEEERLKKESKYEPHLEKLRELIQKQ